MSQYTQLKVLTVVRNGSKSNVTMSKYWSRSDEVEDEKLSRRETETSQTESQDEIETMGEFLL